jgi:hypothetical protein
MSWDEVMQRARWDQNGRFQRRKRITRRTTAENTMLVFPVFKILRVVAATSRDHPRDKLTVGTRLGWDGEMMMINRE